MYEQDETLASLLDHILIINLDHHKSRWKRIQSGLDSFGIKNYERVPAVYGKDLEPEKLQLLMDRMVVAGAKSPGPIGCALSHIKAWQTIVDRGWNCALILEDDVTFNPFITKLNTIPMPKKWGIIFLGHCKAQWPRNVCNRISSPAYNPLKVKTLNRHLIQFLEEREAPMGAYAYCLHRDAAQYFLDNYRMEDPADVCITKQKVLNTFNILGLVPSAITHCYNFGSSTSPIDSSHSDNTVPVSMGDTTYVKADVNKPKSVPYTRNFWIFLISSLTLFICSLYLFQNKTASAIFKVSLLILLVISVYYLSKEFRKRSIRNKLINFNSFPGIYGEHYFDPFANVWSKQAKLKLNTLLTNLSQICYKNNIQLVLAYGSLLGWARHDKQVIPWDDGIAMFIPKEKESLVYQLLDKGIQENILEHFKSKGSMKIFLNNDERNIPGIKDYSWPFVDIQFYDAIPLQQEVGISNKRYRINFPDNKDKIHFTLSTPLATFPDTFENVKVQIPIEYDKILKKIYGDDWKTECISSSYMHQLEDRIDTAYITKIDCATILPSL